MPPTVPGGPPAPGGGARRRGPPAAGAGLGAALAGAAAGVLKPVVGAGCFLMAARIPLTWFPDEKSKEFPFNLIVAPTEPLLKPTRETIPPFQGLDVSPIVWFAILSFLNEIFLGPQGLLILLQNKV